MTWVYGNGWPVHIDFSVMDGVWTLPDVRDFWVELCRLNDLLGGSTALALRFQTQAPEDLYPGYYSRVRVLRTGDWMVNANGTTPVNAAEWDPLHSPYYQTPTSYVKGGGGLSPVLVTHGVVHELLHLMEPFGRHTHNPSLGWIFDQDMSPIPGVPIITPLAGQWLQESVEKLAKGHRVTWDGREVVVPHLLGAGMKPPGPFPTVRPDFAPPTSGGVTRVSDGKVLDFGNSKLVFK
jgi:hypothetical protein